MGVSCTANTHARRRRGELELRAAARPQCTCGCVPVLCLWQVFSGLGSGILTVEFTGEEASGQRVHPVCSVHWVSTTPRTKIMGVRGCFSPAPPHPPLGRRAPAMFRGGGGARGGTGPHGRGGPQRARHRHRHRGYALALHGRGARGDQRPQATVQLQGVGLHHGRGSYWQRWLRRHLGACAKACFPG